MPKEIIQGNFQEQQLWRNFNYEIIKNIYRKYSGIIIIPMTIYDKNIFEEIIGYLQKDGINIIHYILGASKETINKRLSKRHVKMNSWPRQMIDICINGFNDLMDRCILIDTDQKRIYEIVEKIAKLSNIKIKENKDIKFLRFIRRIIVQLKYG